MSTATLDPVFIVDDDPAARDSMAALIQSHGLQAETYDSAEDFLTRFDRTRSGCLVVDVRMSGMSGFELQEQLLEEGVDLPVVVITGYADIPAAVRAMRNGAATLSRKSLRSRKTMGFNFAGIGKRSSNRSQRLLRSEIRRRLATLTADERRVFDKLSRWPSQQNHRPRSRFGPPHRRTPPRNDPAKDARLFLGRTCPHGCPIRRRIFVRPQFQLVSNRSQPAQFPSVLREL